jgi:hypothetical protein
MMNSFPLGLLAEISKDHQWLLDTFDCTPTTIEMEARNRFR